MVDQISNSQASNQIGDDLDKVLQLSREDLNLPRDQKRTESEFVNSDDCSMPGSAVLNMKLGKNDDATSH